MADFIKKSFLGVDQEIPWWDWRGFRRVGREKQEKSSVAHFLEEMGYTRGKRNGVVAGGGGKRSFCCCCGFSQKK